MSLAHHLNGQHCQRHEQSEEDLLVFTSAVDVVRTCREIAVYVYVRENSDLWQEGKTLHIYFDNSKNMGTWAISLVGLQAFALE